MSRKEKIQYKSHEQILKMRAAGLVVADIHQALREGVHAGMTTADADAIAAGVLERAGSTSNFLGYYGYPGHICTSVNEVIVHGIPGDRVLAPGDLVSFDCGAVVEGWHGDAAISMVIPGGDPEVTKRRQRLSDITEECMWRGIAAAATGSHVGDIGRAIDDFASALPEQPGIVEEYVGHGIGTAMHQAPDVLNYRAHGISPRLRPGMVLCVEPMIVTGSIETVTLGDDWTVKTLDGGDAAHWEHTIALLEDGVSVLTAPDCGAAGLAPYGITPVVL